MAKGPPSALDLAEFDGMVDLLPDRGPDKGRTLFDGVEAVYDGRQGDAGFPPCAAVVVQVVERGHEPVNHVGVAGITGRTGVEFFPKRPKLVALFGRNTRPNSSTTCSRVIPFTLAIVSIDPYG